MEMGETLRRSGAIDAIARQSGVSPTSATRAVQLLMPAVLEGFRRLSARAGGGEGGLRDLVDMLQVLGGGAMARNVLFPEPAEIRTGQALLVQCFGSIGQSQRAAEDAARETGLAAETIHDIQAMLAMAIGGYLSARLRGLDLADKGQVSLDDLFGKQED